ncbi:hypothetical protein RUND412_007727 [Rhizina undulata]
MPEQLNPQKLQDLESSDPPCFCKECVKKLKFTCECTCNIDAQEPHYACPRHGLAEFRPPAEYKTIRIAFCSKLETYVFVGTVALLLVVMAGFGVGVFVHLLIGGGAGDHHF